MNLTEIKLMIFIAASIMANGHMGSSPSPSRIKDGKLSDEEQKENLEGAAVCQVYAEWFAKGLLEEHKTTFGFENLDQLQGNPNLVQNLADLAGKVAEIAGGGVPSPSDLLKPKE